MVRVGVDESLAQELLVDFPPEAEIVRVPRHPAGTLDVDFWIIPFARRDAQEVFSHLRGVKAVQSMMAGVDWVLTAILAAMKRFPHYRDVQLRQQWRGQASVPNGFMDEAGPQVGLYRVLGDDLAGKTVLLVGYGSIGSAIEARLAPFGVKILRVARTPKAEPKVHAVNDLHELLPQADIVIMIVPLTKETQGMIGAPEISLMKPGALLVNAARGPVVVTEALIEALQQQRIVAVLDVTDPEPLPEGHPLWSAPNCMITPHIGGSTPEFIHRAFRFGAAQVRRFIAGQELENVVSAAGY